MTYPQFTCEIGIHAMNYEYASDKGCEWEKDWQDVQVVCRKLGIPCELVRRYSHMFSCISERFRDRLISPENIGTVSLSHPCDSGSLASAQTLTFGVTSKVLLLFIFPWSLMENIGRLNLEPFWGGYPRTLNSAKARGLRLVHLNLSLVLHFHSNSP